MEIDYRIRPLIEIIQDQHSICYDSIYKMEHLNSKSEEYILEEDIFRTKIDRLYLLICALLEIAQLPLLLQQFKEGFNQFLEKKTELSIIPVIGDLYSEPLGYLYQFMSTISSIYSIEQSSGKRFFESILRNTPKIIYDSGIDPKNETEVRNQIYNLLIHIFPDTVKDFPISHETKTYKPDIGIKSLKAAAEYKFATTKEEVKKSFGGIYEDIKGYSGSEDWKYFYAVIYMTDHFYTIEQLLSELSDVNLDDNWIPILVYGKGSRK